MANPTDADNDALLQQVIEHLRRQPIPAFLDPEIAALKHPKNSVLPARPISTFRRIAMNRRFQLSAGTVVGIAAVLGFVLLWGGGIGQSVSAMEKMAENIRKAVSYKAAMVAEGQSTSKTGKITKYRLSGTIYWLARGTSRLDLKGQAPNASGGPTMEADVTRILLPVPGKSMELEIDHRAKTLSKGYLSRQGDVGLEMIAKLAEFSGQADRDLGTREIDGKKCRGFEIDPARLFAQPHRPFGPGMKTLEVWIDSKSSLPVIAQIKWKDKHSENTVRLQDLQWNIDLDPKLFDTAPPKGYTDVTPKEPSVEERVRWFTEGLRLYVELTGGRDYPPASTMQEIDATHKTLFKAFGFKWPPNANAADVKQSEKFRKTDRAIGGLAGIASLVQFLNPDAAYYGKTVTPRDKDKVLLRWRLDDGRYEVIFGDLHAEAVAAEKLQALEKR
jgi:outer membrane lipoprotein-sorting protein